MQNKLKLLKDEGGAVMMEYVIIGVLIATACIVAVCVLSRAIFFGFDTAQRGASGNASGAQGSRTSYSQQIQDSAKSAEEYHDSMHTDPQK